MSLKISFAIILFIFCNFSLTSALEMYTTVNVLVSKEAAIGVGDYIIRKEAYNIDGVLVSRPSQTDTIISDMLKANGVISLQDYTKWLQENIKYRRDENGDNWALPEETLERKCGDCEDYAFLNAAALHVLGYHPKILGLRLVGILIGRLIANHAICVFEKDGRYLYFDNDKLKVTDASSMEEFTRYISTHYSCFSISELAFDNKKEEALFAR